MSKMPIIGVVAANELDAEPYEDAVRRSGGTTLLLNGDSLSRSRMLRESTGLIVSHWRRPDVEDALNAGERDEWNMDVLREALGMDIPMLGICRGMHMLNIVLGGGVASDISGHGISGHECGGKSSYHHIYISPGSKLAAIVGSGGFVRVNSRHDQGLKNAQKSPRLMASAYSLEDGVIEALESPDHDWVIGLQFQPERRKEIPPHFLRVFQGLVERASVF